LIAGGLDANLGHGLASAELYNPSDRTFTLTGTMTTGRFFATAVLTRDPDRSMNTEKPNFGMQSPLAQRLIFHSTLR
jgi:hypothetical protein